jgi:hypothetical protein
VLGACAHACLVPLLGFCVDPGCAALVYPLMGGGSLEDRLAPAAPGAAARLGALGLRDAAPLPWAGRLRALRDAARGLAYLHAPAGAKPAVLHRDVKPANILLDGAGNGRLGDVGLARPAAGLGTPGRTHLSTATLLGTPGYIDPLYTESGQYSEVTDGYALGIACLECLAGAPAPGLLDACAEALEEPSEAAAAAAFEGWPARVALAVVRVVVGLSWRRVRRRRMPLAEALAALEAAADEGDVRPGVTVSEAARECVVCLSAERATRFGCGHAACCAECAAILRARGEPCPVCRARVAAIADRGAHVAHEPTFVRRG